MATICIINGHPDPDQARFCYALAAAYAKGAAQAGHTIRYINVSELEFPLLSTQRQWQCSTEGVPYALHPSLSYLLASDHIAIIYPLWLGGMPAKLKALFEQLFRPGIALDESDKMPKPLFTGKSARVVVTMGMPAFVYRWFYGAHSVRSVKRNILKFCGIKPVRFSLLGMVEAASDRKRDKWLQRMEKFGKNDCQVPAGDSPAHGLPAQ